MSDVLVLYMAGRNLSTVSQRLLRAGRDPAEAVALIQSATTPEQTVSVTTLTEAAAMTVSGAPVLVVIGPVVALRDQLLAWQVTAPMGTVPQQSRAVG